MSGIPSPVLKKNKKGKYASAIDDEEDLLMMLTLPLVDVGGLVDNNSCKDINDCRFWEYVGVGNMTKAIMMCSNSIEEDNIILESCNLQ